MRAWGFDSPLPHCPRGIARRGRSRGPSRVATRCRRRARGSFAFAGTRRPWKNGSLKKPAVPGGQIGAPRGALGPVFVMIRFITSGVMRSGALAGGPRAIGGPQRVVGWATARAPLSLDPRPCAAPRVLRRQQCHDTLHVMKRGTSRQSVARYRGRMRAAGSPSCPVCGCPTPVLRTSRGSAAASRGWPRGTRTRPRSWTRSRPSTTTRAGRREARRGRHGGSPRGLREAPPGGGRPGGSLQRDARERHRGARDEHPRERTAFPARGRALRPERPARAVPGHGGQADHRPAREDRRPASGSWSRSC